MDIEPLTSDLSDVYFYRYTTGTDSWMFFAVFNSFYSFFFRSINPFSLNSLSSILFPHRPMILSDFSSESNSLFVVHILTVPGFVLHINSLANEVSLNDYF